MLVLGRREVEGLLDLDALSDALATAMVDMSGGRAHVAERLSAIVRDQLGMLVAMPGYVASQALLVAKLVTVFPRNAGTGVAAHQSFIHAFDPRTGSPVALLEARAITAARTAACSALSARMLARADASVLAVLGTGVQARAHARALPRVRPITRLRIAGRDPDKAAALAQELAGELELDVSAVGSYEEALDGADIVCAATHAIEPVVRRSWLSPGTHVTSVGYNPHGREVDDETVADAVVCVDSRLAALAPPPHGSNDLLEPMRDGVIAHDHVRAELGELLAGTVRGRAFDHQITLYKSVGVAVQDAAAAALVIAAAREAGVGVEVDI